MSDKDCEVSEVKAREERAYREARMGRTNVDPNQVQCASTDGMAGVGLIGATMGPGFRWVLENRRQQHLREAAAIQSLLDSLPAKLPADAEAALRDLIRSK